MGKDWDHHKGGRTEWVAWLTEVMREVYRVLKPGAHGFVWALPKTSHWTAWALEEAGFEIRDCVTHHFGTGFPKSMDVSKAIDKKLGAKRDVVSVTKSPFKLDNLDGKSYQAAVSGDTRPLDCDGYKLEVKTSASSDEAKQWEGWGTALKPGTEFWWLIRKPLGEKTVAGNVLEWGTGGLNIDACRIPSPGGSPSQGIRATAKRTGWDPANPSRRNSRWVDYRSPETFNAERPGEKLGRWPSNMVHDGSEEIVSQFPHGVRFFYCTKASRKDKTHGGRIDNRHPTVKSTELMSWLVRMITPPGGTVLDPFLGSGSTGVAALRDGFRLIGIEAHREYYQVASERLEDART